MAGPLRGPRRRDQQRQLPGAHADHVRELPAGAAGRARPVRCARSPPAIVLGARGPAARAAADLPGRVRLPRVRADGRAARAGPVHARRRRSAPADPVFSFLGWPFLHSPYGPLFTLASYATAPLGLAGGLWTFKAFAVASSLGAVALVARAARRLGHSARWAAAFVGLNPVLLALAVGGAHNDTLVLLLLAARARAHGRRRARAYAPARRTLRGRRRA